MRRLFSWIDVELVIEERRQASQWPTWLVGASAYHDALVVRVRPATPGKDVIDLMSSWFGARLQAGNILLLESAPDQQRPLRVEIEETTEEPTSATVGLEPLFRRVSLIIDRAGDDSLPAAFPGQTPPIIAFHSFKGGVGRTTELLGIVVALATRSTVKTLIIDADLEAPGITALVQAEKRTGEPLFSFVDLLAVAHGDRSPNSAETLTLATQAIRKQLLPLDSVLSGEHYFLPAFRDRVQTLRLDIRPEHLVQTPGSHWIIGDLVAALARNLKVDAVLVDLRAGLSELSSPFLLDSRLRRVLVTTPSEQSVEGTSILLNELSKLAPPQNRQDLYDPQVLISFVTEEYAASGQLETLRQRFYDAYRESDDVSEPDLPRLRVEHSPFATELLYASSLSDAIRRLYGSGVVKALSQATDELVPRASAAVHPLSEVKARAIRSNLASLAKKLEYAESGEGDKFLSIAPIRALAKRFESEPPIAVIVGSKGAGKTYICLQLIRAKRWAGFRATVSGTQEASGWGCIWPFLQSKNLQQSANELVVQCKRDSAHDLRFVNANLGALHTDDAIQESLQHAQADERWWRIRWFDLIARSLGISSAAENEAASRLVAHLQHQKKRMVIVIDGLEDLFPALETQPAQQVALRALLQGLPAQLREIPNCPLGLMVFVRADLVSAAIPQNVGQFERLYEAFALRWNEEEALRLATWIAREANGPVDLPPSKPLEIISGEEARSALVPVWGKKLGPDNSREARTAEWVIAALSDFRGQIQARDLVRFFRYAAEKSETATVTDRVLTPRAIRDAIQPCSDEKIREIKQEIPPLKDIFAKLLEATSRRIPFDAATSGLSADQIHFLEATGVVIEDKGEYFMPEIFRLGLGFQLAQGARPRVLSLARRAVGKQTS